MNKWCEGNSNKIHSTKSSSQAQVKYCDETIQTSWNIDANRAVGSVTIRNHTHDEGSTHSFSRRRECVSATLMHAHRRELSHMFLKIRARTLSRDITSQFSSITRSTTHGDLYSGQRIAEEAHIPQEIVTGILSSTPSTCDASLYATRGFADNNLIFQFLKSLQCTRSYRFKCSVQLIGLLWDMG